jgi:hypothetical protein
MCKIAPSDVDKRTIEVAIIKPEKAKVDPSFNDKSLS